MSRDRKGAVTCLVLAALTATLSCARHAPEAPPRIAILRFENLSGDASLDWAGRALSESIGAQLLGVPGWATLSSSRIHSFDAPLGYRTVSAPGISAERMQALAAGATRAAYGTYALRNGRIEARLTIEDPALGRTEATLAANAPANDVIGLAASLARQISPAAKPAGTQSQDALRRYSEALEANSVEASEQAARSAIAADPSYAPPSLLLSQIMASRQDRAGALAVLDQAAVHAAAMPAYDRARVRIDQAVLRDDPATRRTALLELAAASPADPTVWRTLAEDANAHRDFRDAVGFFRKGLALDPSDIAMLNVGAYAAAYTGDLSTGAEWLSRYQKLRPAEPNPLDSLGDIYFYRGRFKEAEDYYLQSGAKDPAFIDSNSLFKAAFARLSSGDIAGAGPLYQRYRQARETAKDPLVDYHDAEWMWLTGHRREAVAKLSAYAPTVEAGPLREVASRSWSQLTVWKLCLGDRAGGAQAAERAVATAGPASGAYALLARFIAQPQATASEWAIRAERTFPAPQQAVFRNFAKVYALLLAREFTPAAALLHEMQRTPAGGDETLSVLAAWAYLESGRTSDAAPLIAGNPAWPSTGATPFATFHFPRLVYLRGRLAEKQQNREAARTLYRLFLTLSGPDALQWGEEQHAREFVR